MEKILSDATLCFPLLGNSVLLGRKKRHIGAGLFNGYGGGIEREEDPETTAVRELEEESGLRAKTQDLKKIGVADFHNQTLNGGEFTCRVHIYSIRTWHGNPRPSKEMDEPTWFAEGALPYNEMMAADRFWLPVALVHDVPIYVRAWYGPRQEKLIRPTQLSALTFSGRYNPDN